MHDDGTASAGAPGRRSLRAEGAYTYRGLAVAVAMIGAWAVALGLGLAARYPGAGTLAGGAAWALLQSLAYTGLFITAHEAMHGLVAPAHPRLERALGRLALSVYAALPYDTLRTAHHDHHRYPSTERDPDYHEVPGEAAGFWRWYARFVWHYATWWQVLALAAAFNVALHGVGVPLGRLWLHWITPMVLSTLQLFTVGTYLPHRAVGAFEGAGPTRARSVALPSWASLLACFHFGYHYEHHAWPGLPWWRLPRARARRLRGHALRDR